MMNPIDIQNRSLGVHFTADQQAYVRVWAPLAKDVAITLNSNTSTLPLTKDAFGYWSVKTDQLKPGDLYKFILDNELECADPASLAQPQGIYGPSQAIDTSSFYWEDSSWVNPPISEYSVYELDIHTFTSAGTLKAIVNKLGYLKKMGFNTILIKPVTPFPGSHNRYWTGTFLYTVQASYGGPCCLQHLINACHYEGIAVILDLPYNHVDQQENFSSNFVMHPRTQSSSRSRMPAISDEQREVHQRYYIENALMWFRDFHVDGIHLETAHTLPDSSHILRQIREYTNQLTAVTGRQHYVLAEQELSNPVFTGQLYEGKNSPTVKSQRASGGNDGSDYNLTSIKSNQWAKTCQTDYIYDRRFASILQKLFTPANRRHFS